MNGCGSHGQLVGGYVLGALEPDEMEEMRRHLEGCPHCSAEAERLRGLRDLLDRIEPADVPPPTLSPQVEEAVLDRFAKERGRRARPGGGARPRPWRTPGRLAALAGAVLAALVLALALAWPFGDGSGERGAAYASARLAGVAPTAGAGATAQLAEVPAGTRVRLRARGLPVRRGAVYQLWCIRTDGRWVSGGTFRAGADGRAEAELTAAVQPGDYHLMVVTHRPERGTGEERGNEVLRGQVRY